MLGAGGLEVTPEFLGHKGCEGVQQAQAGIQHTCQGLGGVESAITAFGQLQLGNFHVPVSKLTPEEVVNLAAGLAVLMNSEQTLHIPHQGLQASPDP